MAIDLSVYDKIGANSLAKIMRDEQIQNQQTQNTYAYKNAMLSLNQERINAANSRGDEVTLRNLAAQLQDPTQAPALFKQLYNRDPVAGTDSAPVIPAAASATIPPQGLPPVFKDVTPAAPQQGPTQTGATLDTVIQPVDPVTASATARAQFAQQNPALVSPANTPPNLNSVIQPQPNKFVTNKQASLNAQTSGMDAGTVDAYAQLAREGKAAISPYMMRSPQGRAIISAVVKPSDDPSALGYDANRMTNRKFFQTGQGGNELKASGRALAHMGVLDQTIDALNNGDIRSLNELGNTLHTQFGDPAVTNFDTARQVVAGEVTKYLSGGGGTLEDRNNLKNAFGDGSSVSQLKGALAILKNDFMGQMQGSEQQYINSVGDGKFTELLTPMARQFYVSKGGLNEGAPGAPASIQDGATATNPQTGEKLVRKGGQWVKP